MSPGTVDTVTEASTTRGPTGTEPAASVDDRRPPHRIEPATLGVVGGAALAAVACVVGIGDRPLWTDEAITLGAVGQLGPTLRGTSGSMALYYVLLDPWTEVFGTSRAALRALSAVLMVALVMTVGGLARRILPPVEAVVGTLMVAGLPAVATAGREARSYALTMALTTLAWCFLARAVEAAGADGDRLGRSARRWILALVPVCVAGVLAHGWFTAQLVALCVSVVVLPRPGRILAWLAVPVGAAGVTAAALYSAGADRVADWILPLSRGTFLDVAAMVVAANRLPLFVLLALAGVGAVRLVRARGDALHRWRSLVPVVWAIVPFSTLVLISLVRPYLVGRYLLPSAPAIGLLAGVGATHLVRTAAPRPDGHRAMVIALVTTLVVSSLLIGRAAAEQGKDERWDAAAAFVGANAEEGDGIIFTPSTGAIRFSVRTPFEAAWRDLDHVAHSPDPIRTSAPLGEVLRFYAIRSEGQVADEVRRHDRIWIVHRTRADSGDAALEGILDRSGVRGRFATTMDERFDGNIQVMLLEVD